MRQSKPQACCRPLCHPLPPPVQPSSSGTGLRFTGRTSVGFSRWQAALRRELDLALGVVPDRVSLDPEVVETRRGRGYVAERVVFAVEPGLCSSAWVCRPARSDRKPRPAVLCCHGHGPGKDPLVGLWRGRPCLEYHKLIAVRLAAAGCVTVTPDRRGYGDCSQFTNGYPSPADLRRLEACYRERHSCLLRLDAWDAQRALDLLTTREDVDPGRIGCLGVESGATVAGLVGVLDSRVGATVLTCFARADAALPGGVRLESERGCVGSVELCSLLAPRPLLLQAPEADPTIALPEAQSAARHVRRAYALAEAPERCELRTFDGVLELDYDSAAAWFRRWL